MADNRREFLRKTGLLGLAGLGSQLFAGRVPGAESLSSFFTAGGDSELPPLPYAYDALEPFIDAQTMQLHHGKHHKAYLDKLKTAPASEIDLGLSSAENCLKVDEKTSMLVRNNLGGHYNHSLFWPLMKPNKEGKDNSPEGKLAEEIKKTFNSYSEFKSAFSDKAAKIFGSGWCWLVVDGNKKLKLTTTPNQDNPLMKVAAERGTPVLALDVWEHAYYLKYQNKRADYIAAWWNVVNWQKADELYAAAMK
jgi:superoxide dismutase, Fe-Mn family